jgi:hypothetical protein
MILRDHEYSENSLKIKNPNALSAAQRRGSGQPEQCAPDKTQGRMENASLNTGAKCKRYVCAVLHNVMQFRTRKLFMHKIDIQIYRKIFTFLQAW